nr:nucleoside-diphosphate kinase [Acidimicrobiia bacterium]
GDFGLIMTNNIVHGSDSPASAERELALFFG